MRLWKNCVLCEASDAVLVSNVSCKLDVLLGHSVHRHGRHWIRVGHFRQTHQDAYRRSFLRQQIIVDANDRSIPNDPSIG